jgi:hypothetical protein
MVVRDFLHLGEVQADASVERGDAGLQATASSVGNDGNGVSVAQLDNLEQKRPHSKLTQ